MSQRATSTNSDFHDLTEDDRIVGELDFYWNEDDFGLIPIVDSVHSDMEGLKVLARLPTTGVCYWPDSSERFFSTSMPSILSCTPQ